MSRHTCYGELRAAFLFKSTAHYCFFQSVDPFDALCHCITLCLAITGKKKWPLPHSHPSLNLHRKLELTAGWKFLLSNPDCWPISGCNLCLEFCEKCTLLIKYFCIFLLPLTFIKFPLVVFSPFHFSYSSTHPLFSNVPTVYILFSSTEYMLWL